MQVNEDLYLEFTCKFLSYEIVGQTIYISVDLGSDIAALLNLYNNTDILFDDKAF